MPSILAAYYDVHGKDGKGARVKQYRVQSLIKAGTVIEQQLPGLFYADDIVFLASKQSDMQRLPNICGQEGENLGLKFSFITSDVMVFNVNSEQTVSI